MDKQLFRYPIRKTGDVIWEVEGLIRGEYDAQAVQYDKLVSNGIYNKIMWGNSPKDYTSFCRKSLHKSGEGSIVDVGCGSLSFTYEAYAECSRQELILCDLSQEMLKIGAARIQNIRPDLSNITFLRSNALDMPFTENAVNTVFSFGIFHLFNNPGELIREMVRILKPSGKLFLTSLCSDRKLSGWYLKFLHQHGHVATPLKSNDVKYIIEENGMTINEIKRKGGMAYVTAMKR